MSIEEKIRTMETIWDNLCRKADSIPSPSWHEEVLIEREKRIKNGEEEFKDLLHSGSTSYSTNSSTYSSDKLLERKSPHLPNYFKNNINN